MDYLAEARKALAEAREYEVEKRMPILPPRLVGVLAEVTRNQPEIVLTWTA